MLIVSGLCESKLVFTINFYTNINKFSKKNVYFAELISKGVPQYNGLRLYPLNLYTDNAAAGKESAFRKVMTSENVLKFIQF